MLIEDTTLTKQENSRGIIHKREKQTINVQVKSAPLKLFNWLYCFNFVIVFRKIQLQKHRFAQQTSNLIILYKYDTIFRFYDQLFEDKEDYTVKLFLLIGIIGNSGLLMVDRIFLTNCF